MLGVDISTCGLVTLILMINTCRETLIMVGMPLITHGIRAKETIIPHAPLLSL